ncbi:MAG TPA: DUF6263 family protein [Planctomycetota bacterium]
MKLLMTAALLLCTQDGKVELKWKFEKGRELTYKQTQKQSMEFAGTAMEQESSQTQVWTVKDVAGDGTATIETKCVAVASKASGAMEFEYDSEKDKEIPENPQVKMMAKMVGKVFTLKMTPSGKIVEMKGFDALMEEMLKELGDDVGPMKEMLKQMLSDDTMKSAMQQLAPMLPEKPVGKGDAWKNDFTLKFPMIGGMKFGVASTMTELKDGEAHIGQTWTIELKGDDGDKDNPLGGLVKITDSKGKAQIVFSADKGCFVSQKMTMELTMDAGGQQIPVKTESVMKLVDKPKKNF